MKQRIYTKIIVSELEDLEEKLQSKYNTDVEEYEVKIKEHNDLVKEIKLAFYEICDDALSELIKLLSSEAADNKKVSPPALKLQYSIIDNNLERDVVCTLGMKFPEINFLICSEGEGGYYYASHSFLTLEHKSLGFYVGCNVFNPNKPDSHFIDNIKGMLSTINYNSQYVDLNDEESNSIAAAKLFLENI
jgi:hypothetical protein